MKKIALSKTGKKNAGKYFALVDDEDYEWLNQWNWKYNAAGYASRYISKKESKSIKNRYEFMHRKILKIKNPKIFIDHKDRNGLNNQKNNIRKCTSSQNCKNRKAFGASIYRGVCIERRNKGGISISFWKAQIRLGKKDVFLGHFKTEIEAAIAYNKAAKKHHKEFANLNKI